MKKKALSMVLTLCILVSALVIMPVTVSAISSESDFASKIATLQSKFKNGEYWNKYNASDYSHTGTNKGICGGSYCNNCICECGYFAGGYQCYGFANKMAYETMGAYYKNGYTTSYSLGKVYAGDIIRFGSDDRNGHSIFVYKVVGSTIYFADCNFTGPCQVRWGGKIDNFSSSSSMAGQKFLYIAHLNGNTLTGNGSTPTTPTTPTIPTGTQTVSDGDYHIVSALDNSFGLNVAYNSGEDRANVQLWDSMGDDDKTSVVNVSYLGSGFYSLTFKNSGKALDVAGSSSQPRTNVQQYTPNSASDAQKWIIKSAGNGYYYIISKCGGNYLDVLGGTAEKATNIQVYTGNSSTAQKWKFVPSGVYTGVTISDGEYHIVSALDNSLGISAADNSKEDGANVQLGNNMGDDDKTSVISVQHIGSGIYTMKFLNSGKSLDVYDNSTEPRTNVQQCSYNYTDAQKWIIKSAGNGYFYIIGKD